MADSYWRYPDARQQPPPQSIPPPALTGKRSRSDYAGGQSARSMSGRMLSRPVNDPLVVCMGNMDQGIPVKDRNLRLGSGRPEVSLPPDAANTLYVEGLPHSCTIREVAHIFRPFVGYREVRLVNKEPRHPGQDPLVLCFVDFISPAHAATAMDALQALTGYMIWHQMQTRVNANMCLVVTLRLPS